MKVVKLLPSNSKPFELEISENNQSLNFFLISVIFINKIIYLFVYHENKDITLKYLNMSQILTIFFEIFNLMNYTIKIYCSISS